MRDLEGLNRIRMERLMIEADRLTGKQLLLLRWAVRSVNDLQELLRKNPKGCDPEDKERENARQDVLSGIQMMTPAAVAAITELLVFRQPMKELLSALLELEQTDEVPQQ